MKTLYEGCTKLINLSEEDDYEDDMPDDASDELDEEETYEVDSCPECDSENISVDEMDDEYCVRCEDCGYTGQVAPTPEEAIDNWNE